MSVSRDPGSQRLRFIAPSGEATINCTVEGYPSETRRLTLEGGVQEVRLALRRSAGVRISVWEADARLPVMIDLYGFLLIPEGARLPATPRLGNHDEVEAVLFVDPGTYELRIRSELPGYEPFAPVKVEVLPGEISDVRMQAVRKP